MNRTELCVGLPGWAGQLQVTLSLLPGLQGHVKHSGDTLLLSLEMEL